MTADPFAENMSQSGDDPWDSNQAIPSLMFGDKAGKARLEALVPELKVISVTWLSLFAYPLSGGFKNWCLMPSSLVDITLRFEDKILPFLGRLLAFRLFIVVERC